MYVQEANDRAEIAMRDREDREDMARARLEESYRQEWFDAVTAEPLDSFVIFDSREVYDGNINDFRHRASTVLDLFNHQYDYNDFDARVAKIVIDAHKAGNVEATSLLNDMASAFAGQKV